MVYDRKAAKKILDEIFEDTKSGKIKWDFVPWDHENPRGPGLYINTTPWKNGLILKVEKWFENYTIEIIDGTKENGSKKPLRLLTVDIRNKFHFLILDGYIPDSFPLVRKLYRFLKKTVGVKYLKNLDQKEIEKEGKIFKRIGACQG